jgi:hypothetical protein
MFVLHNIVQKLHTQFLKFSPPPFFMALEVFLEKSKKMNMETRQKRLESLFSNRFLTVLAFWKAWAKFFSKN